MAETRHPQVEERDIWPSTLWLLGLGFAAFVAASAGGLLLFFRTGPDWEFQRQAKPEPVLQVSPRADYEAYLAAKRAELHDSGWIDRDAGLVEIPIEAAMRLVAQGHRAEAALDPSGCTGAGCPAATPTARTIP